MAFTYDEGSGSARDRVRLELGDTNPNRALFTDAEIDLKLDDRAGTVLLTTADLCGILARRFAGDYDFKWKDQQSFSRSQMSKQYATLEAELRARVAAEGDAGLGTIALTRVDGYSDDLSTRDGAGRVPANTGRLSSRFIDLPY